MRAFTLVKTFDNILTAIKIAWESQGKDPVVYINGELYPIACMCFSPYDDNKVSPGTPVLFLDKHDVKNYQGEFENERET